MKNLWILIAIVIFLNIIPTRVLANSICEPERLARISRDVSWKHNQAYVFVVDETSREKMAWRKQHPTGFGALLGLSIGVGTGAFFAGTGDDTPLGGAVLIFGGIGAGIGALIGSFY